jgi:hypothetical protein
LKKEEWTTAMQRFGDLNLGPWIWLAGITLLTTLCVWGLLAIAPWENMVPDFVCYWAAGELIASGHSPYDVGLQAEIQGRCGWDKSRDGLVRGGLRTPAPAGLSGCEDRLVLHQL